MKPLIFLAALFWALCISAQSQKLSQYEAARRLRAAGITWRSSGGCTLRTNPRCTSFQNIRATTVAGAITLKKACNCGLAITGGTEVGHATGKYSHATGYKLDFSRNAALDRYITRTFKRIANRSDGVPRYKARSGNIYANEGAHWDVVFFTDGRS
ncbi:hypothetical protein ACHAQA_007828 [Verticillium albo-atrum]